VSCWIIIPTHTLSTRGKTEPDKYAMREDGLIFIAGTRNRSCSGTEEPLEKMLPRRGAHPPEKTHRGGAVLDKSGSMSGPKIEMVAKPRAPASGRASHRLKIGRISF